jgi:hypothetical protein
MDANEFTAIHTLDNRFESDVLMDALEQEEIPAILRSFEETAYTGLFVPQRGWGKILVPKRFVSKARAVIYPLINKQKGDSLFGSPDEIDPGLWEQLQEADPKKICTNAFVKHSPDTLGYIVPFLGSEFLVLPEERRIEPIPPGSSHMAHNLSFQFYLALLHYLLEAKPQPLAGKWVSEKELPGGSFFFRGPHELPTKRLLKHFGSQPQSSFRKAAEDLYGVSIEAGDAAFVLQPFPRIPLLLILWEGDDEFGPALHVRFDATVNFHLQALDTIWALVNIVAESLIAAVRKSHPSK